MHGQLSTSPPGAPAVTGGAPARVVVTGVGGVAGHGLCTALNRELADATKIIVAQRIGTIRNADKILVLDDGKIVGMGTHDDLLRTCKTYQEIARSQLSEEELQNA